MRDNVGSDVFYNPNVDLICSHLMKLLSPASRESVLIDLVVERLQRKSAAIWRICDHYYGD